MNNGMFSMSANPSSSGVKNGLTRANQKPSADIDPTAWMSELAAVMGRDTGKPDKGLAGVAETPKTLEKEKPKGKDAAPSGDESATALANPAEQQSGDDLDEKKISEEPSHRLSVLSANPAHAADGKAYSPGGQHISGLPRHALESHALVETKQWARSAEASTDIANAPDDTALADTGAVSTETGGDTDISADPLAPVGDRPGVRASVNGVPGRAAERLMSLIQDGLDNRGIRNALMQVMPGEKTDTPALNELAAEATRRKLMDAMSGPDAGAAAAQDALAATSSDGLTSGATGATGSAIENLAGQEALTERAVDGVIDPSGLLSQGDGMIGTGEATSPTDAAATVSPTAEIDWIEVLEQQTALTRLRETDALRVDLQLADSQRVALEAQLEAGILTLRMAPKADGSQWIPPEQIEALKAALRESSPDVKEVVFDQSADLGAETPRQDQGRNQSDSPGSRGNAPEWANRGQGRLGDGKSAREDALFNGIGRRADAVPPSELRSNGLQRGVSLRA